MKLEDEVSIGKSRTPGRPLSCFLRLSILLLKAIGSCATPTFCERRGAALAGLVLTGVFHFTPVAAADLPVFALTVYAPPSYSSWLPALIKKQGFDIRYGFTLKVSHKVGTVAYLDTALGNDYACGCISPITFSQFVAQGAKVSMIFNIWLGTSLVAVADPAIRNASDLQGRILGVDRDSAQWAVTAFILEQAGLDLTKVKFRSAYGTSQVAEFAAGRVDAFFPALTEVASLQTRTKEYHIISVFDQSAWQIYSHSRAIPSITLGVSRSWVRDPSHLDLVRRLYAAYRDAADYARQNPEDAADTIFAATKMEKAAVKYVLAHFPEALSVEPISNYKGAIKVLTQELLVRGKQLGRPMTDEEVNAYVSDFSP